MIKFLKADIVSVQTDVIVNAANAEGYMGGWLGKVIKLPGVAESIHYHTKGKVEKIAKQIAKKVRPKEGDVYITSAEGLNAKYIFHAVTMFKPGSRSKLYTIERCLIIILNECKKMDIKKIALPALGIGTGGLNIKDVAQIYKSLLSGFSDLTILIVDPTGRFIEELSNNNIGKRNLNENLGERRIL